MRSSVKVFRADDNVLSIKYVTWLRRYLRPLGFWPGDELNDKMPVFIILHRNYIVLQCLWLSLATLNFIHKYFHTMDLFQKSYVYLLFLLTLLCWLRVIIGVSKSYANAVKTFLCSFHLANRELQGRSEKQVLNDIERICYVFTLMVIIVSFMGMTLFNIGPLYLNYKNGFFNGQQKENTSYICIVCFTIPKVVDTHEFGILSTIVTVYLTLPCTISVNGLDLLLMLMAFHVIGNILVLRKRLETLCPRKNNFKNKIFDEEIEDVQSVSSLAFTKEENKIIHEKLVDCIKYQNLIIMFTKMVSNVFGPMLEFNHVFHLTACCLLLLECSGGTDAIFRFGTLTAIIFSQLILLSVILEIVASQGEKLINSVYFTPWDRMDTRNRRTVHIMLLRAQRPICITGMGLTTVGVTTMAQILKATASYYVLLSSDNNNV